MSATYTATAVREGRWWMVTVPGAGVTQARRLADVPDMARELVAVTLDAPLDDVEVQVTVAPFDGIDVTGELDGIREARAQSLRLEREASDRAVALARTLAQRDVPLRDIGTILGVSHQRAHQLVTG